MLKKSKFFMVIQPLSAFAWALLTLGLVTGCGENGEYRVQLTADSQPQPTGGKTKIMNPDTDQVIEAGYISAGKKLNFAALEEQTLPVNNAALAKSISNVEVTALDENRRMTQSNPKNLFVRLYLESAEQVEFLAPLETSLSRPSAKNILQRKKEKTNQPLSVSLECETPACASIEMKFQYNKKTASGTYEADTKVAGVLFTKTQPQTQLLAPSEEAAAEISAGQIRELEETVRRGPKVTQSSFSVVTGVSKSQVQIQNRDLKNNILSFTAPVIDTSEVAPVVESNQYVRILGIDPETNDMMIEVQQANETSAATITPDTNILLGLNSTDKAGSNAPKVTAQKSPRPAPAVKTPASRGGVLRFLLINPAPTTTQNQRPELGKFSDHVPPTPVVNQPTVADLVKEAASTAPVPVASTPTTPVPTPVADSAPEALHSSTTGGLFPTNKTNTVGVAQSESFAKFGQDAITQKLIGPWKSKVRLAIPHTPAVSPYITQVFESLNMTTEFAYIMLIESGYLLDGEYKPTVITTAANCGTAFGPWQIVNNTALGIKRLSGAGFQYTPIKGCGKQRMYSNNDDRGYLVQSTFMAAHYLNYLIKTYKLQSEPIMAVVGYNQGDSGPANARNAFFRRFKNYNIDYRMVRKFNMAKTSYANQFLAFREVGQNTQKYGLNAVAAPKARTDIKRLSRAGGPTPTLSNVSTKAGQ